MHNLKPCPFCAGNVTYTQHHIECLKCAVLVLFDVDLLKEDVIVHWNTRATSLTITKHWEASQRALALAMRENRIHTECLELAREALEWYKEGSTDGIPAQGTLIEIETRLAELK